MTNENKKCSSDYSNHSYYRDKSQQQQQQQQLLHTMEREFTATRVQKLFTLIYHKTVKFLCLCTLIQFIRFLDKCTKTIVWI